MLPAGAKFVRATKPETTPEAPAKTDAAQLRDADSLATVARAKAARAARNRDIARADRDRAAEALQRREKALEQAESEFAEASIEA